MQREMLTGFRALFALGALAIALLGFAALPCMAQKPDLGVDASLHGKAIFPRDNPWNQDISAEPVDPNSDALIASMGRDTPLHPCFGATDHGMPNGIPYMVVPGTQPLVPVQVDYKDESEPGPYPVPLNAPIEGGPHSTGDRHVLILDRDHWKLYEFFSTKHEADGWHAASASIFDLHSNKMRPAGWTSSDAAGLPILPGLVRYDEVFAQKMIAHALRFTIVNSRHAYVYPARHYASSKTDPNLPPMGMRIRLKANYDLSQFPPEARVILTALKKYGMIVADNGANMYVTGAPDRRWNDGRLGTLKRVKASDFEVVKMGHIVTTNP